MGGAVTQASVELARASDFRLGVLMVRPSYRELVHADGRRELIEPRLMQMLVALATADGIVSRVVLTECCWGGRIVGDDAINRVISRLRRISEGIGAGSFEIETVTKVTMPPPISCARRHSSGSPHCTRAPLPKFDAGGK